MQTLKTTCPNCGQEHSIAIQPEVDSFARARRDLKALTAERAALRGLIKTLIGALDDGNAEVIAMVAAEARAALRATAGRNQ